MGSKVKCRSFGSLYGFRFYRARSKYFTMKMEYYKIGTTNEKYVYV